MFGTIDGPPKQQPWELVLFAYGEEQGVLYAFEDGLSAFRATASLTVNQGTKEFLDMVEGHFDLRPTRLETEDPTELNAVRQRLTETAGELSQALSLIEALRFELSAVSRSLADTDQEMSALRARLPE